MANNPQKASTRKARIMVDTQLGDISFKANQVIEADAEIIEGLVKSRFADDTAAAVKYCTEKEGAEPILYCHAVESTAGE